MIQISPVNRCSGDSIKKNRKESVRWKEKKRSLADILITSNIFFKTKMPLFGKSQKTPAELVKALKEAVNSLERGDKKAEKAQEDVSKNLVSKLSCLTFL